MTMPKNESTSSSAAFNAEEAVSDTIGRMKDQASRYGKQAVDAVDGRRESAAGALRSAASGIRSNADSLPGGPQVGQMANQAADTLEATATYVREHEAQDMLSDLQSFVKAHPAQMLIGAVVVGFLVGRSARN